MPGSALSQFEREFERVEGLACHQNTPIEELLVQYETECCDFTDIQWVAQASLRLSESTPDSQARYLLYALARRVAEQRLER